jgi:hypothetical protein
MSLLGEKKKGDTELFVGNKSTYEKCPCEVQGQ